MPAPGAGAGLESPSARNELMQPAASKAAPASAVTPNEIADSFLVVSITSPSFCKTKANRHRTRRRAPRVHATVAPSARAPDPPEARDEVGCVYFRSERGK